MDKMSSPLVQAIGGVLSAAWTIISIVKFPGTEMPISIILVGGFVAGFGIRIFVKVMGGYINITDTIEKIPREKKRATGFRKDGL